MLQNDILTYLNVYDELNTWSYAKEHNLSHQSVVGAIRSIQSKGDVNKIDLRLFIINSFYLFFKRLLRLYNMNLDQ